MQQSWPKSCRLSTKFNEELIRGQKHTSIETGYQRNFSCPGYLFEWTEKKMRTNRQCEWTKTVIDR